MKVTLTAQAEADLRAIGEWITRDNPARAVTFVAEDHGQYPLVRQAGMHSQVRRRNYKGYRIVYDVRSQANAVDVLFIHQGSRAYPQFP